MKIYEGKRTKDGCEVTVDGKPLPPRLDLWNHSPAGFEFGYGGSGPAQLALAILADFFEVPTAYESDDRHHPSAERAIRLHQFFKFLVISGIKGDSFKLTADDVAQAVHELEREKEFRSKSRS